MLVVFSFEALLMDLLGDDSDCIEVQFDDWQRALLPSIKMNPDSKEPFATTAAESNAQQLTNKMTSTTISSIDTCKISGASSVPSTQSPVVEPDPIVITKHAPVPKRSNWTFYHDVMQPSFVHPKQRLV